MNKFIIMLVVVSGLFISCNDDFLERYPIVEISDGGFWKTATDLKLYVNSFYNNTEFFPRYTAWFSTGIYSLDADNGSDTYIPITYVRRMNGENTVPASHSNGEGWAVGDWGNLRSLNYFMDNYKKSTEPWDVTKTYVGEVLFLRGLFYYNQLRRFGDLPFVSTALQTDSKVLFEARLPRNQVVDSIMHDMDLAVEYLPARTAAWTGRITKETAMLLQARIALYEGTWEKYHALKNTPFKAAGSDGSKFIRKAAEVSGALMALAESNGNTALANVGQENGYFDLFNLKDYSTNKEVMLWRKYSVADGSTHLWLRYTWCGAQRGLTKSMIDSYLCTDGKPISESPLYKGDADLKSVVANRDPRLNQTIYVDDGKHFEWKQQNTFFKTPKFDGPNEEKCITGYQLYKGHSGDRDDFNASTSGLIYFRYAEALLIYAEARTELGEITQSDVDKTINALRRRVGMTEGLLNISSITADPNWEFEGISPILQEVRRERKVELACEGFRVDDIFRWAAADKLIKGVIPKGAVWEQWRDYPGASAAFTTAWTALTVDDEGYIYPYKATSALSSGFNFNLERDYLLPIPSNEITLNLALKQNPGW